MVAGELGHSSAPSSVSFDSMLTQLRDNVLPFVLVVWALVSMLITFTFNFTAKILCASYKAVSSFLKFVFFFVL